MPLTGPSLQMTIPHLLRCLGRWRTNPFSQQQPLAVHQQLCHLTHPLLLSPADAPPPFESAAGGSNIMAHLSEKERLRRQYEAQDAAHLARQNSIPHLPPPAAAGPLPGQYANALEEEEALRKKFEERDKAAKANTTPQKQPPPLHGC